MIQEELMEIEEKPIWKVSYKDEYFPIRDEDGKPAYREYQKEAIVEIVNAMNTDKKFVAMDGPVGSGKSVINYSVARCFDNVIYITSQKQLQDQIIHEQWSATRMLKGKNAYRCNYCRECGVEEDVFCSYKGSKYKTCDNTEKNVPVDVDAFIRSVYGTLVTFGDDEAILTSRSSFRPGDDVQSILNSLAGNSGMTIGDYNFGIHSVVDKMKCKLANIECPVRSARFLIVRTGVKVLNPDVYYNMNSTPTPLFNECDLMIIDECHGLDSSIQRIFGSKVPVDFLKDVYGIDMTPLCKCALPSEFATLFMGYFKKMLGPVMVAGRILNKLGNIYECKENGDFFKIEKNDDASLALKSAAMIAHQNMDPLLDVFQCLMNCFNGEEGYDIRLKRLYEIVREQFVDECKSVGCDTEVDLRIISRTHRTNQLTVSSIIQLQEILDEFCKKSMIVVKMTSNGLPIFVHKESYERRGATSREFEGRVREIMQSHPDKLERCIDIIPVNIGAILSRYFFSNARKVLLSTGTWVDPEGMLKSFGINLEDVGIVIVKSTFSRDNRPIYIVHGEDYTDFSEKSGTDYVYKTAYGEQKFCDELSSVIRHLRLHIAYKYNENANVLIHCFSFDIAKRIARSFKDYDDSVLIHLPYGEHITNIHKRTDVPFIRKEDLLDYFIRNRNSGLTLVSPSMQEGVDFKYDIARAQIILKSPIPNVGDTYIKTHMKGNEDLGIKRDYSFLDRCIYMAVSQQYGRIVRAKDDWGITVVMDQHLANSIYGLLMAQNITKLRKMNINYLITGVQGRMLDMGVPVFKDLFVELKTKG
jgi:Rad3-related DNA helicase